MAKTQFAKGAKIMTTWINSIFGNGATGGHRHDGADADGHCGKINLTNGTDVSGLLPPANLADHVHSGAGGQMSKVHPINHIDGVGPFGAGIISMTGFSTSLSITYRFVVEDPKTVGLPKWINLYIPEVLEVSSGTMFGNSTGSLLEEVIRPLKHLYVPCTVFDSGNPHVGAVSIYPDGRLSFLIGYPHTTLTELAEVFSSSGYKGVSESLIRYPIYQV